ncbi:MULTISPECIES: hypothetical protein [unclassified Streptomyces]|uniref:hypothetical protein n=1 Tax=unclassified Streptomyces TaxID=2593676 RepID=UPI00214CF491|nr:MULTISPECIES: hypothetical protein [unclassified Streptomyces]MCX5609845.1 hypothetical protein [Streptomyces sp. NBC_00047]UUU43740.1 hypothetical protein JIW86_35930 [Streptomyces sp. NBC_00162]
MNHTAKINHDAVLRARVALLGSGTLPVRQQVAAFRVLVQVSPLAYLPLLAVALYDYSRQEFADRPETALALRAESVAAARRMYALEPERADLLLASLAGYREQLGLMDRRDELGTVDAEIALVASGRPLVAV